jgi:DNA-binding LacI/PurR family transcriptional regulator
LVKRLKDKITIKDIANFCGVSPSLVSKTLNNRKGVNEETKEKILKTVARLEYSPNLFARGLVAQKSNILGVIIPQRSEIAFANPYFPQVLQGISNIATEKGYHLLISFPGSKEKLPFHESNLVSGVIILGNLLEDPNIYELERRNIPAILIPGLTRESPLPSVDIDNVDAGYQVTKHLLNLGHRKIGFLIGHKNSKYSVQRFQGYQKAFQEFRLFYDESIIVETTSSVLSGFGKMSQLLTRSELPTAVICLVDVMAIGAISAIKEKKLSIPNDISVISFGDIPLASMLEVPLTTIRIPFVEIGKTAGRLLMDLIEGQDLKIKKVVFPVELIIRNTTKELTQ